MIRAPPVSLSLFNSTTHRAFSSTPYCSQTNHPARKGEVMETTDLWRRCQYANVRAIGIRAISLMRRLRNALPRWSPTIAVAVLTAQRHRRRTMQREIKSAARQLERTSPLRSPVEVSVIVQQYLGSERPLAGCYQVRQRSDGSCRLLFRLAMTVDGRYLDSDSILAVFAEEWIALAAHQAEGPVISVPIDLLTTTPKVNGPQAEPRPNDWEFQFGSANLTGRAA